MFIKWIDSTINIKYSLMLVWCICGTAQADVWRDQAQAFHDYGKQLASQKYPDYNKAYHFYCVSTAMLNDRSALAMGHLYLKGNGVPNSPGIAKNWFLYSASLGNLDAINILEDYIEIETKTDISCPKYDPQQVLVKEDIMKWLSVLAPTFGLDPAMVYAVIKVESNFNPKAVSPKNAQGLMQLLPSTARRFGVKNPLNPVQNMIGGMTYLRYLLGLFKGDLSKTWAAYNAGEKAVIRNKGIPPYLETLQYVRMLLALYPRTYARVNVNLPFVFTGEDNVLNTNSPT